MEVARTVGEHPHARSRADAPGPADGEPPAAGHMHARAGSAPHLSVHGHALGPEVSLPGARTADVEAVRAARDARALGHGHGNGAVAVMRDGVERLHAVPLRGNGAAGHVHPDAAGVVARRALPDPVLPVVRVGAAGQGGQRGFQSTARSRRLPAPSARPPRASPAPPAPPAAAPFGSPRRWRGSPGRGRPGG